MDWLLEPDDVGVRYLAIRDLIEVDAAELADARKDAHTKGPIAQVLTKMDKEGFWVQLEPRPYYPMHAGTVRAVVLLAQLGAAIDTDERVKTACDYIFDHNFTKDGRFTETGLPSGNRIVYREVFVILFLILAAPTPGWMKLMK